MAFAEPELEGAPMKDYDSTVARIAGNIASGMALTVTREPGDEANSTEEIVAIVAVKVARAIIAEVKRTESPSEPSGTIGINGERR